MENEILRKLNSIAREYTTSRNLIKNINKRFINELKITSCEESGCGYRVITLVKLNNKDSQNYLDKANEVFKFKLFESNNRVEFKLYSSKDNYTSGDVFDILKTGDVKVTKDTITIVLDDLTAEDMEIMLKGLGRR